MNEIECIILERLEDSRTGFTEYETVHRIVNNNVSFFIREKLDQKVYTGLCLGSW